MTSAGHASFELDDDRSSLVLSGPWVLEHAAELVERAARTPLEERGYRVDARAVTALDTAGALVLIRTLRRTGRAWQEHPVEGLSRAHRELLELVARGLEQPAAPESRQSALWLLLERVGTALAGFARLWRDLYGFAGLTLATLAGTLVGRHKLRVTATVFHMEQVGLDALPIVSLLSLLIGAVVAFLGASVLREFGAQTFTIQLVVNSVLREFGVLLTAILLAGRSGSAFTAQIGSMMSREEVDAIHTLGLDPVELLVIPRLLALLVMLPLLTFVAMAAGIAGGGLVCVLSLDMSLARFLTRLQQIFLLRHFVVGMVKAPVFAVLIALVGCNEGFKVEGSAESVGRHTTSSVVQAIFLVIVFDSMFALWFMEMAW